MSDPLSAVVQSLLSRLAAGDARARDELIHQTCSRLDALARKMLRSYSRLGRWEDTADVFQESALRLFHSLSQVTPATPRDYFRLAACQMRRVLIDMSRHYFGPQGTGANHASAVATGDSGKGVPAYEGQDQSLDGSELAHWTEFHEQVERLPEVEREVFDLLWYQEMTQEEAAAVLGVTDRTVRQRWREARSMLVKALDGNLPSGSSG